MRQRGASIFIYLIFGLLIVIFVINFAPQSGPGSQSGCGTRSNTVVTVDGVPANRTSWQIAYSNQYNPGRGNDKKYVAIDTLIRRELLAEAAAARGIRVTKEMVDAEIMKGFFFLGGVRIPLDTQIFDKHDDGTRTWNVRKFQGWYQSLNVSKNTYLEEQKRGLAATMMAELIASSVRVSRDEALDEYLFDHNTVTYDVVTFSPGSYRDAMRLTDADIARFLTTHEEEVKARYKADERTYKGTKPALKLRQIFIAKAEPEGKTPEKPAEPPADPKAADPKAADPKAADPKAADPKAADPKAADPKAPAPKADPKAADPKAADPKAADAKAAGAKKPVGLPIEEAKAKLEATRTAAATNKQKFIDAAKQLNTDEAAKANGGELGWRSIDSPQLGDKALGDAIKALKPGELSAVVTTDRGAYLFLAEDKREGDLTYDQVKAELAVDLARDVWSKEAAKRAALDAHAAATASGKKLEDLYQRAVKPVRPGDGIEQLLNDPNTSDEVKRMILEQMRKQMGGGEQGSITFETKDVPAAWKAAADGTGGSGGSATGSGSAAPAQAPAAGSGAGSGSAAPTPPPADPKPVPLAPSKDVLPAFGEVTKPTVIKEGPTPRMPQLPSVGKELVPVLFDELSAGMLAKQVYEADGSYVLVQVVDKSQAKVEDFDKEAANELQKLREIRGRVAVEEWLRARCTALAKDSKIKPAAGYVTEQDEKGNDLPVTYQPCSRLSAIVMGR